MKNSRSLVGVPLCRLPYIRCYFRGCGPFLGAALGKVWEEDILYFGDYEAREQE